MKKPLLTITRRAGRMASVIARNQMSFKVWLGICALLLGFWGWQLQSPPQDAGGWFNNLFRTIQLVTLQFPTNIDSELRWQLHVARFLVPSVAALATFHLIIGAIARPVRMALMPHTTDHIIICGAERLTQSALDVLAERKRDIVFLTSKIDATRRETLEGQGLVVVEAEPADASTFDSVNLARASAIFLTADDDVRNFDLATLALSRLAKRPETMAPLVMANLIERETLARELDVAFDLLSRNSKARYIRLSPEREGLKLELERFAPCFMRKPGEVSHTLVIGLDGHWRQVLKQLIITMQDRPDGTPRLSLVLDGKETEAFETWAKGVPDLPLVVDIDVIPRQEGVPVPPAAVESWVAAQRLPHLIVLLRPETEGIEAVLTLRSPGGREELRTQPILVRRAGTDLLIARLSGLAAGRTDFRNIGAFGGHVRPETIERILDPARESLAAALHNHYLDNTDLKTETGSREALDAWRSIPENMRHANRGAASHLPILLASEGYTLERTRSGDRDFQPDPDMVERLARIEHQRWMADRIDFGWRYAPERNDARREHDCLVPFEELSPANQQKDRDAVLVLVRLVQATGCRIVPAVRTD